MRKSNINFLLGWFIVGFSITYILFNVTNMGIVQSEYSDTESFYENKFLNVELRQNCYSYNYARLPIYSKRVTRSHWASSPTIKESESSDIERDITADYAINIGAKSKNTINKSNIGYSTSNYLGASDSQNYSAQKNENRTNTNEYSGLTQAINQLATLNNQKPIKIIQGSSENVKTIHGFLTMNTDLKAINSSMTISENNIQKIDGSGDPGNPGVTGGQIDPGAGGEMGDPIPVGDGWIFLFVLALGYGFFKHLNILQRREVS